MTDVILLSVDAFVTALLYHFYKQKSKTLDDVRNAVELDPKKFDKNSPDEIEYGLIRGIVKPEVHELTSNYNQKYAGVIRVSEVKEHRSNFRNNVSTDTVRTLSKVVDYEPFKVQANNLEIKVDKPLNANYLLDNLHRTYTHFDMNKSGVLSKVAVAVFAKEHIKGIETTESMLLSKTNVCCFGKLVRIKGPNKGWIPGTINYTYQLSQPESKEYIITSLSRPILIDNLKSTTKILKYCVYFFGCVGLGIGAYIVFTRFKDLILERRRAYRLEQARLRRIEERQARAQRANENANRIREANPNQEADPNQEEPANEERNACVICLTNPREVILLDCGHVCLCMDCLEQMPTQTCPICRAEYRTFAPCYIA